MEEDQLAIRYRYLEEEAEKLTWFEALPGVEIMGTKRPYGGAVWFWYRLRENESSIQATTHRNRALRMTAQRW